jgi:glycosyltransferase involved in cell wall biosynthesis
MTNSVNVTDASLADMSKIGKVTVLMPTLNEAAYVEKALCSLWNQNIIVAYPDNFEIVVVDSESTDGTVDVAEEMADRVITAPRGKLTAIDTALRQVDGDIVVAVDGDSYYGTNFVNLLLRHFEDPQVVGVSGSAWIDDDLFHALRTIYGEGSITSTVDISDFWPASQRMLGSGCAYSRAAYFTTGGFDLSINQNDLKAMVNEEEIQFWQRLKKVGKCIREMRAALRTGSRRFTCDSCSGQQCDYCGQVASGQRF